MAHIQAPSFAQNALHRRMLRARAIEHQFAALVGFSGCHFPGHLTFVVLGVVVVRTELVDVHQAAEKLRGVVWANEPVATLEDSLVALSQVRAMVDAAEIEALGAYDASKEWKATGALTAQARLAELTCGPHDSIGWRRGLARKLRTMPHTVAAFELGDLSIDHVSLLCRANLFALAVEFALDEVMLVDKARTLPYDEFARELCSIRSVHCEIDHLLEWTDGGLTDADNGRPLCKGHNLW